MCRGAEPALWRPLSGNEQVCRGEHTSNQGKKKLNISFVSFVYGLYNFPLDNVVSAPIIMYN